MKPIQEGTGEEGKVIVKIINIGFLQSEANSRYSHIDGTRVGWPIIPRLALQSLLHLLVQLNLCQFKKHEEINRLQMVVCNTNYDSSGPYIH